MAAFLAVIVAFMGSSVATYLVSRRIDTGAKDLLVNALPSVRELMHATAAENRLDGAADLLLRQADADRQEIADELTAARADLDANVAASMATPEYPGERELYDADVRPRMAAVDGAVDRLVPLLTGEPRNERAVRAVATELGVDAHELDRALLSLSELNHDRAFEAAETVLASRVGAVTMGLYLNIASTALTVAAALLVARASRRFASRARAEVEREADRARELDCFAQRVAHDLLNPLAGVALSLGAVARLHDDPGTTRTLQRAKRALERARRMVSGIYAFSKSGARPAPGSAAPLRSTILEAVDEVLAAEEEAPPGIEVGPFEDVSVAMDRAVLGVVVSNLLSNAAKYMRGRPVRQAIVRSEVRDGRARVEVEDTGPGFPPGMEAAIFEPYRRAASETQPGLGLGLATVKRIVVAHGGAVGVLRAPTGGSVFWFEIPLVPATAAESPPVGVRPGTTART